MVGFFLQHFAPLLLFPSLADFLGTGDFLAHPLLGKGGGVHIFTRAAALTLFKSSEPRYLWLYLTQLGFEQTFFQTISPYPLLRLLGVTFGQTLMLGGT